MYRIRLAIVAFLLATLGLQAQEGFYYQAVIKNTDGSPLKETLVKIRIRIIEGTTTLQYEEEKEVTTSREGFVSFIIGEGATTDFTSINWQGELYLQDEIDTGTGYGAPTRMPLLKTPRSYISDRAISVLDNSITSASILDGTISNDDLSAAASISFSKLSISASDIEGLGFLKSDENFTSALKTKLDGIEAGAQVTDATSVEAAGALMDSEVTNLADIKAFDPADYATAAQGALADSAQQVLTEGAFVDGDKTKLDGIETGADVTDATNVEAAGALMDAEVTDLAGIKALTVSSKQDVLAEGAFVDGDKTKLDGIETGADVTDATNVEAAGALMDAEVTDLAGIKALTVSSKQDVLAEGAFVDGDKTKLDGIETGADVTDATNVEAAGALMDAEVTDLAGIKALTVSSKQDVLAEGAFVDGDKTKLDGIETGAEVTDATNVEAAGALMDAEVTDLAGIKALTVSSKQDVLAEGAFVDGDKTKLDGIETGATADQTQADINGLAITEVGTISSGTWNGTAIAITHGGTGATTASAARNSLGIYSGVYNLTVNGASEVIPIANLIGLSALNQSATIVFHSNESGLVVIQSVLEDSDLNSTLDSIRVIFSANSSIGDKISYIIIP